MALQGGFPPSFPFLWGFWWGFPSPAAHFRAWLPAVLPPFPPLSLPPYPPGLLPTATDHRQEKEVREKERASRNHQENGPFCPSERPCSGWCPLVPESTLTRTARRTARDRDPWPTPRIPASLGTRPSRVGTQGGRYQGGSVPREVFSEGCGKSHSEPFPMSFTDKRAQRLGAKHSCLSMNVPDIGRNKKIELGYVSKAYAHASNTRSHARAPVPTHGGAKHAQAHNVKRQCKYDRDPGMDAPGRDWRAGSRLARGYVRGVGGTSRRVTLSKEGQNSTKARSNQVQSTGLWPRSRICTTSKPSSDDLDGTESSQ